MQTLPDFIAPNLDILSIGINPSLHAARAGYPFAFARNRFWPALNHSLLVRAALTPGLAATQYLLDTERIGFTDVVKRATPGAGQLRARDFAEWVPLLREKISLAAPNILWFHGKIAVRGFARYLLDNDPTINWGLQTFDFLGARCFVSPNPSPANARFSLDDITRSYNELALLRA